MKKDDPLVTVVMPVYNASLYLCDAVDSILNQTYKNIELICVNDASTDNSLTMLNEYREKNLRVKIINLEKNVDHFGSGEAVSNYGIKRAKGKYIAIMDSDDISTSDRIEKQVQFLETHRDYFLIGSQANLIDSSGKKIGERDLPLLHEDIYENFFLRNGVMNPSVMFRKNFSGNFYKIKYKVFNDYWTYFNILRSGKKIRNLKSRLINYRIHQSNTSFTSLKEKFGISLEIKRHFLDKGYKPKLIHRLIIYLQSLVIKMFPDFFIMYLYKKIQGV